MHTALIPSALDLPSVVQAPALPVPREVPVTLRTPELSVVIVNYHCWQETVNLVWKLRASPVLQQGIIEVVVVDNHSPHHPLARRLRSWSGVALRRWGRNRGFARAVNEAGRLSLGRWILLLNPDVQVPDNFVETVLAQAERLVAEDPQTGVVGFGLLNSDGSRQLSCGPFPTLASSLLRLVLPRRRRKYHARAPRTHCRVPWVTGCCLMVRRDCFEQLGGFDEAFFLYYEDVDFCRRATDRGWSVWYEPAVNVTHHRPLHSRPVPAHLRLITRHALLTYARKHWPSWQFRALAVLVQAAAWLRGGLAVCRGDHPAARVFQTLRALTRDLADGQTRTARRRLDGLVRQRESCRVP
jgi:GT2 family glycosyltransferase